MNMTQEMFHFYKNALTGAIAEPLCDEYKSEWRKCGDDKKELVTLAMRQQSCPYFATYCYQGKGVSKAFIEKEFKDYINGYTVHDADGVEGYTYGLYVNYDYDNDLVVDKDVVHVMWTVGANVVIQKTKCPTIYVSNRSKTHIICEGYNHVRIYLFDKCEINIEDATEDCSITVFRYSKDAKVIRGKYCLTSEIKVFDKPLKI